MRLDKALSLAGHTRSEAKKLISQGRVCVNGVPVRDSGLHVKPEEVLVDGRSITAEEEIYLMIHKPAGVVTATEDKRLPTVVSLLPENLQRRKIGPVGRLDRDVTGLVLLTTNGQSDTGGGILSPKAVSIAEGHRGNPHLQIPSSCIKFPYKQNIGETDSHASVHTGSE